MVKSCALRAIYVRHSYKRFRGLVLKNRLIHENVLNHVKKKPVTTTHSHLSNGEKYVSSLLNDIVVRIFGGNSVFPLFIPSETREYVYNVCTTRGRFNLSIVDGCRYIRRISLVFYRCVFAVAVK